MEVGGAAPGLPGPEAFEVEWSSSSSEESPVYATKPVFNLFTVGSERRRGEARRRKQEEAHLGDGGREIWGEKKNKQHKKQQQQHVSYKTGES